MHPGNSMAAESVGENSLMQPVDPDLEGAVTSPGAHCSVIVEHVLKEKGGSVSMANTYMLIVRANFTGHGWCGWRRFGCRGWCCVLSRGIPLVLVPRLPIPALFCMQYRAISARLFLQGGGFDLSSGPEQPDQAATDEWGIGGAANATWPSQHEGGQPAAEQGVEEGGPVAEVTWELILQWADYYRSQGSTDDELRTWIATTYPAFAHHLAELPADTGAHGWAQQQQQEQQQQQVGDMHAVGNAGQTLDDGQIDSPAAGHSSVAATATAKASESMPGPDAAGQPGTANPAEALHVHRSNGDEVLPLQQIEQGTQGFSQPQSASAQHSFNTGHTDNINTVGMVRPAWCSMCRVKRWQSSAQHFASHSPSTSTHLRKDTCSRMTLMAQESGQEQQLQSGSAFEGLRGSEGTASGKLTGPLPWDVLGDHSDDENSTAGRPADLLCASVFRNTFAA